jgi:hypothetical protein
MQPPGKKSQKQARPRSAGPTGGCAHNIGVELADKQRNTRRGQRVDAAQSKYVPKFRPSAKRQWPWSPNWEPNQPAQNEAVTTLNEQLKCYNNAVYRENSIFLFGTEQTGLRYFS